MKNKVKNIIVSLAVLGALSAAGNAQPHQSYPWIQNPANGHFYRLLPAADWKTSEHWAQNLGGHLASISDKNEQDWVFSTFTKDDPQRLLWIGLKRSTPTGQFTWSDGSSLEYANWFPGEPNDTDNAECFVAMYYGNFNTPGSWNDWGDRETDPAGVPFQGVVEMDQ